MLSLGILPIIQPSFVGAFTWVILLGRQGVVRHFLNLLLPRAESRSRLIYGMFGMILSMTLTPLSLCLPARLRGVRLGKRSS